MFVGTVLRPVVTPIQHPFYVGRKLLLVRVESPADGRPTGEVVLAVDRIGAGEGDKVLVLKEGSSARSLFGDERAPVRTVIVGHVDEIEMDGRRAFFQDDAPPANSR